MATLTIKRSMNKHDRIADEAIYVNADGKVVKAGDPTAATKVVGKGGIITAKMAERYKLNDDKSDVTKSDAASRKSAGAKKIASYTFSG